MCKEDRVEKVKNVDDILSTTMNLFQNLQQREHCYL